MKKLKKNNIPFVKMSGAGNDFVIFSKLAELKSLKSRSLFAQRVCDRHYGVGADGIVFIEKKSKNTVQWDFFNADGSQGEFCGNAARCVARYAHEFLGLSKEISIKTIAGNVEAEVLKSPLVEINMPRPKILADKVKVIKEDKSFEVMWMDTGVPHITLETHTWDDSYLLELGAYLRNLPQFEKTSGVNATFWQLQKSGIISAATFERGVEDITMACGTGAVAAALAASAKDPHGEYNVQMPGGDLFVRIIDNGKGAKLKGAALFIYEGHLCEEALK